MVTWVFEIDTCTEFENDTFDISCTSRPRWASDPELPTFRHSYAAHLDNTPRKTSVANFSVAARTLVHQSYLGAYSKGLTGGALPLAVTKCRDDIFMAHYSDDRSRTFFHSSSFTANPIACAAALANLEIWEREPVGARLAALETLQKGQLNRLRGVSRFANVRQAGTITAMDFNSTDASYLAHIGPHLSASFRDSHAASPAWQHRLRPTALCVTRDDLEVIYDAILAAADTLT